MMIQVGGRIGHRGTKAVDRLVSRARVDVDFHIALAEARLERTGELLRKAESPIAGAQPAVNGLPVSES